MKFFGAVERGPEPTGYKDAINKAFDDFTEWRKANKIPSSQRRFNFWLIFKDEYGCYFNTKGFNARVISCWLENCLERAQNNPPFGMVGDDRVPLCICAVWFGM